MLRIIREVQPAWFVLENVNGLTTMALETRDVKVGRTKYSRDETLDDYEAIYTREEIMLLNRICEDLEGEGYAVQPIIIPAVALEADHERKRIWIVGRRIASDTESERPGKARRLHTESQIGTAGGDQDAPNAGREYGSRRPYSGESETPSGAGLAAGFEQATANASARNAWDTESTGFTSGLNGSRQMQYGRTSEWTWPEAAARFCRMDDGTSDELDFAGARDNRDNRLKALGNAIYWPCAYEIFAAIEKVEQEEKEGK